MSDILFISSVHTVNYNYLLALNSNSILANHSAKCINNSDIVILECVIIIKMTRSHVQRCCVNVLLQKCFRMN